MYPAGAARIIESIVHFPDVNWEKGTHTLTIRPLAHSIVLHKIVVDCGGDEPSRFNLNESTYQREQ